VGQAQGKEKKVYKMKQLTRPEKERKFSPRRGIWSIDKAPRKEGFKEGRLDLLESKIFLGGKKAWELWGRKQRGPNRGGVSQRGGSGK